MQRNRTWRALIAAALIALPALIGIGYAFLGAFGIVGPARQAGMARITRVLSDPAVWSSLAWSVWTAFAATALAFMTAALLAITFRGGARLNAIARFLIVAPLPVPHLAAAVMGVLILGQSGLLARIAAALGWITQPAQMPALIYDVAGTGFVLSMAWKEIPFLGLIAMTVLAQRGAAWEEAARTLGAGPGKTLRLVTWPLLWRGMLPGATAAFVFVAGTFEAAVLLAPSRPLPLAVLQIERYTDANLARRGDAYVIALLLFALAVIAVLIHEWLRARAREAT
jgi:putative spermidine/putrescine transport system permease protein